MTLAGWGAVFGRSLLEWRKCLLSGRQLESLLWLWTFLLSSACVCVNFDFRTCSFILTPWRNKKWVSCRSGVLGQIMDTMEVGEQPAGMSDATKRRKNEPEELSSESEWDATVGRSSDSPAIDNQARYVTEGDTVVAKPIKGGKSSAVKEYCCSSGSGRFQRMESNGHCDGQVCRYQVVFLRAHCSWWGRCKDCTLHLMDRWHLLTMCRERSAEPGGRFWYVCQSLRLETQAKGLSKEDQVDPCWISMGISDRCSYSLWVWLQSIALWAFW